MINAIDEIGISNLAISDAAKITGQEKIANQFLQELQSLNDKQINSEHLLQDLSAGKTDNIHHVMLALEDAKLSLQLFVQVRNKLLEGYQDVLRMQV